MYLICINSRQDPLGGADYRQGIREGWMYHVTDDNIHPDNYARGEKWWWNLARFRKLSQVEAVILMKNKRVYRLP